MNSYGLILSFSLALLLSACAQTTDLSGQASTKYRWAPDENASNITSTTDSPRSPSKTTNQPNSTPSPSITPTPSPSPSPTPSGPSGFNPTAVPAGIQGYGPLELRKIYENNAKMYLGEGVTVCIGSAYQSTTVLGDVNTYATQFNLPKPDVTFVKVRGTTDPDTVNWHVETILDIDMVISVAPKAKIIVLEAQNASVTELQFAISKAQENKCDIVSMSYGAPANNAEVGAENIYKIPGITFLAATGDTAGVISYPALQPGVIAVGGTTLTFNGTTATETVWNNNLGGEGAGLDTLFPFPSYQTGFNTAAKKQAPEITAIADPNTGVAIYADGKWGKIGGTSASSPLWAGILAQAYEARRKNKLSAINDMHTAIYQGLSTTAVTVFRDITTGTVVSAGRTLTARAGYDAVSGFGSPRIDAIVNYLATH